VAAEIAEAAVAVAAAVEAETKGSE
jgi:hypothetical protein